MALVEQQPLAVSQVDLPDLRETFVDAVRMTTWDGQTVRVELCVTRYPEPGASSPQPAKRYPVARLVLTPGAAAELFNNLQQTMSALAKAGVVKSQTAAPPGIT